MLEITCPCCGPRVVGEFSYLGEIVERPEPATADLSSWRRYLYEHENQPGPVRERWMHSSGCGTTLKLVRHQVTNEIAALGATGEA
jgi:heterotetrameric sarcosine oxidase delta subunit